MRRALRSAEQKAADHFAVIIVVAVEFPAGFIEVTGEARILGPRVAVDEGGGVQAS